MIRIVAAVGPLLVVGPRAQDPLEMRFASQPVVGYTLRVDPGDLTRFDVAIRLKNLPDTFRLAMAAHPEYEDRFFRYVEDLEVSGATGPGRVVREDSAVWPTGGLMGGPHSFMYVLGGGLAPAQVRLELPAGWRIATGLAPAADPHTFFAPSAAVLTPAQRTLRERWMRGQP